MRSPLLILTALALAGCGGHSAAPSSAPAPAARPAAAEPTNIRFTPGTVRYRYEQQQHASQEVMGQTQENDATTTMILSAVFTAGEGGNINAAFTVDSVSLTSSQAAGNPLDAIRGKVYHAVYTPQGRPVGFTPPDSSAIGVMGGEMFKEFLPTLPTGSLAAGTTWTDTVNPPATAVQGMTVRTSSIRTHRVVGWETHDGVRAVHITTVGTYTLSGEGEQNGAPLQLAGTGNASSERFVAGSGMYLGAIGNDSTNIHVTVVSMGLEIPIRQTRRTTLTRLP